MYTSYLLMRTFGWTWQELISTPHWVINELIQIIDLIAESRVPPRVVKGKTDAGQ